MPLQDIVNVIITRQTQTVTEQGFGIPMIFGAHVRFDDLIKFYTNMDEVALDFSASDPEYVAAQDIFSQTISPNLIAIGRRQVDSLTLDVVTAMTGQNYNLYINGNLIAATSSATTTYAVATLNSDLVPGNRLAVTVKSGANSPVPISTATEINYSNDFGSGSSIVTTLNGGAALPAVNYLTDQATTIGLVAAQINAAAGVDTATVTGPRQITVVFDSTLQNVVTSSVTTGGNAPTATMTQRGVLYNTSALATMQYLADQIALVSGIASSSVSPSGRILTVQGPTNTTALITNFVVTGGVTQPTATITNPLQAVTRQSIAADIYNAVIADGETVLTVVNNNDGTLTFNNSTPGEPFTFRANTTIGSPNRAIVNVTQVMPNTDYTVTINNVDFTYRSAVDVQTSSQIAFDLVDVINTLGGNVGVTATNLGNGQIQLTSDNPNGTFSVTATPDILDVEKGLRLLPLVAANSATDDLDAINNANNTWYALIATTRDEAQVLQIAAWVEARIKLFGTASSDPVIINTQPGSENTSIAAKLGQLGYVRTFVIYHQDADYDYPEAAWFGAVLPLEPGSETWKFKQLAGISYSNLTTTQSLNALGKKANTYEFVGGVGITANGTVAQGEYIDIIRGVDWLTARIQEYVFRVLVNNPKVPYTDAGIAAIQAEVLRVLQIGIDNDFIAADPEPTCTVPLAANVPPADKANRILRNVRFQATLAGAIHAVVIRGTVSV